MVWRLLKMAVGSDWVSKPITDKRFINLMGRMGNFDMSAGPWIAGGCIRKLWQGKSWVDEDVDLFFPDRETFKDYVDNLQAKYKNNMRSYVTLIDQNTLEFNDLELTVIVPARPLTALEEAKTRLKPKKVEDCPHIDSVYSSDNAITFSFSGFHTLVGEGSLLKIQAICRDFPPTARHLVNNFDWTVCQFVSDGRYMWAPRAAVKDLEENQIVHNTENTRAIKVPRLMKYLAYGFDVSDEIMMKTIRYLEDGKGREVDDDY